MEHPSRLKYLRVAQALSYRLVATLVVVLLAVSTIGHESLYWEWSADRAVRQGKWKLVWDKLVEQWELYDVAADRTEMNDLAETHSERAKAMADAWFAWADRTGNKY